MNTTKKLRRVREVLRSEKVAENQPLDLAGVLRKPRWRRQDKSMRAMLAGIDPDRFEALALDGYKNASVYHGK